MNGSALPPEAGAFVLDVVHRLREALGSGVAGVYGFGSLALGDFDPASSDLDLLVATPDEFSDAAATALREMHERIGRHGGAWARRLEVLYLPVQELAEPTRTRARRTAYMSPDTPFTTFAGFDESWVLNLEMARTGGVRFDGPPPESLIPSVTPERIREAVRTVLCDEWVRSLAGPEWMRPRKYQAFVVLTMCRALHAMETGALITKPAAAAWALRALAREWHPAIRRALATRGDPSPDAAMDELPATLAILGFAIARARALR